jgi:hypothetical protein
MTTLKQSLREVRLGQPHDLDWVANAAGHIYVEFIRTYLRVEQYTGFKGYTLLELVEKHPSELADMVRAAANDEIVFITQPAPEWDTEINGADAPFSEDHTRSATQRLQDWLDGFAHLLDSYTVGSMTRDALVHKAIEDGCVWWEQYDYLGLAMGLKRMGEKLRVAAIDVIATLRAKFEEARDAFCGLSKWKTVTACLALLGGLTAAAAYFFREPTALDPEHLEEHSYSTKRKKGKGKKRRKKAAMAKRGNQEFEDGEWRSVFREDMSEESSSDSSDDEDEDEPEYWRLFKTNQVTLRVCGADATNHGRALLVYDTSILLNMHYFHHQGVPLPDNTPVQIRRRGINYNVKLKWDHVTIIHTIDGKSTDMCVWHTPVCTNQAMPTAGALYKHFVRANDVRDVMSFPGAKYSSGRKRKCYLLSLGSGRTDDTKMVPLSTVTHRDRMDFTNNMCKYNYSVDAMWSYACASKPGWCGSALCDDTTIYGIHCLGVFRNDEKVASKGLAQIVTREMLESTMHAYEHSSHGHAIVNDSSFTHDCTDVIDNQSVSFCAWDDIAAASGHVQNLPRGDFVAVGVTDTPAPGNQKTKLVRTLLTGPLAASCDKVPVPLSKDSPNCPSFMTEDTEKSFMANLHTKFATRQVDYHPGVYDAVVGCLVARVGHPKHDEFARVWTMHEALNPTARGATHTKPIPRATGAGYYWKNPRSRGKTHIIDFNETSGFYTPSSELERVVESKVEMMLRGEMPRFLWASHPKDEIMSPDKIETKAAREITSCPTDLAIIARMYLGDFFEAFRANTEWGHTSGMDFYNDGWDQLIKSLLANAPDGFDTDVKFFDSTMGMQFINLFAKHVEAWYRTHSDPSLSKTARMRDARVRRALFLAIGNNYTIIGRTVFQTLLGNCTGNFCTFELNCFKNLADDVYVYVMLAPRDEERLGMIRISGFTGYFNYVKTVVCGDDAIRSVHPVVSSFYNQKTYCEFLAKYGMTVTPADKGVAPDETLKPVLDMSFCSCTTTDPEEKLHVRPGLKFYANCDNSSLSKCVAFVRPSASLPEPLALRDNIEQTLRRAWNGPRARFDTIRADLSRDYNRSYETNVHFPTWGELWYQFRIDCEPLTYQSHGITVSKTSISNHLENLADSSFQSNQTNKIEAKTSVDAKANMDNPNMGLSLGGLARISYPLTSTAQGVSYGQPMAISQEIEPTLTDSMGQTDDLAFSDFARLTWFEMATVTPTTGIGNIIAQWPLCPNHQMIGLNVGERFQPTSLCYIAQAHALWRGSIRYSIHPVIPGVATARLAVAVLYDIHDPVTSIENILSQGYIVFDVCNESKVLVFDVPYNANTELLEIYNGQTDPTRYSGGTVYVIMLNAYRVPESASQNLEINFFMGAGPDFDLRAPFARNDSVVPQMPANAASEEFKYESHMMSSPSLTVCSADSGITDVITMKVVSHSSQRRPSPICNYPQTFRHLARRPYRIYSSDLNSAPYVVIPHGSFLNLRPLPSYSAPNLVKYNKLAFLCAPFRMWSGSMMYRVFSRGAITCTFRAVTPSDVTVVPFVDEPPASGIGLPWTASIREVGYVDSLVPFASRYGAMGLNWYTAPGPGTPDSDTDDKRYPGAFVISGITPSVDTSVFISGGDGFNFGVPYIVPELTIAFNMLPDNYPAADELRFESHMETSGPEDLLGATDEKVGTIMVETASSTTLVQGVQVSQDYKMVSQPELNFRDFLARHQLLGTTTWSVVNPIGASLFARDVPFGMMDNTSERAKDSFRYGKYDLHITMKVNATSFHAGRLVMFFVPLSTPAQAIASHGASRTSQTFVPHVFLDATASSSATLVVPYRYVAPLLRNSTNETYGAVVVAVFNTLMVGDGGQPNLPVTFFSAFENTQMRVINPISLT